MVVLYLHGLPPLTLRAFQHGWYYYPITHYKIYSEMKGFRQACLALYLTIHFYQAHQLLSEVKRVVKSSQNSQHFKKSQKPSLNILFIGLVCESVHTHIHTYTDIMLFWRVRRFTCCWVPALKDSLTPVGLIPPSARLFLEGKTTGPAGRRGGLHCHHPVLAADTWGHPLTLLKPHNVSTTRAPRRGRQCSPCLPRSWWHDQTSQHG